MTKVNISELAQVLVEKNGLSKDDAEKFIKQMFDVAGKALNKERQLKIKGFGTFKLTKVKDRESINVNTGERIVIEGRDKINFTPDAFLRDLVNKPFALYETVPINDGIESSDMDESDDVDESDDDNTEVGGENAEENAASSQELHAIDDEQQKVEKIAPEKAVETLENESVEPVEENVADSIQENVVEPIQDNVVEPKENVVEPIQDNVVEPKEIVVEPEDDGVIEEETLNQTSNMASENIKSVELPKKEEPTEKLETVDDSIDSNTEEATEKMESESSEILETIEKAENSEESVSSEPTEEQGENSEVEQSVESDSDKDTEEEEEEPQEEEEEYLYDEDEEAVFVIAKKWMYIGVICFVALAVGLGIFAYRYDRVAAQRDELLSMQQKASNNVDSINRERAKQDSIRLQNEQKAMNDTSKEADHSADKEVSQSSEEETSTESDYNDDPRVRTGAYRIIGVARTVTVKEGQTIAEISRTYLGSGMECYVEAMNGKDVSAGQKVKIPKLKLKKRKG